MTNRTYVDWMEFDKTSMTVRVDVIGHPTDALAHGRDIIASILGTHGRWQITQVHGSLFGSAMLPSDFKLRIEGERIE